MGEFKVPRNEDRSAKGNTYILKPHPIFKDKYLLHDGKPYSNKEAYRNIEKISHHAHFIVGAKHNGQWYKLHDQGDTPISVHEKDLNGNTHKIEEMKDFRNLVKTTYVGLMEMEGLNEANPSKYEKHMNMVNDIKHHLHDFKGVGEEKTNPTEFRGQLPESKKSQLHELLTKTHGYRHSIKYGGDYYRKGASGVSVSEGSHPLAKPGHRFVFLSGTEDQPQVRHG